MSKMKEKNIEELNKEIEASDLEIQYVKLTKALDEGFKGLILNIYNSDSNTFFGNTTYENRKGYAVEVKINSENGETFQQFFSLPDIRGLKQSNLYGFEKKYKQAPKKGLEVDVLINENGFFEIVF